MSGYDLMCLMRNVYLRTAVVLCSAGAAAASAACTPTEGGTASSESLPENQPAVTAQSGEVGDQVTRVDASRYEDSPGRYHFRIGGNDSVSCSIVTEPTAEKTTVYCPAKFSGDTAPVNDPVFGTQPPNMVVLTEDGYRPRLGEGGPPEHSTVPVGSEITVGGAVCSSLDGGYDCSVGNVRAKYVAGSLTLDGPRDRQKSPAGSTTSAVAPSTGAAPLVVPEKPATTSETFDAPGTACGAAAGRKVVEIVSGRISCTEALQVFDRYDALPTGAHGNANIQSFDGWSCSSPTYVMSHELGYAQHCTNGDIELQVPLPAR